MAYRLHAGLEGRPDRHDPQPAQKFFSRFERPAQTGQCVNQPYLGCRAFDTRVRLVTEPKAEPPPITDHRDPRPGFPHPTEPQPVFFRAQMTSRVIEVDAAEDAR